MLLNERDCVVFLDETPEWIKLNPGQKGFYRTLYSSDMLQRLVPGIKVGLINLLEVATWSFLKIILVDQMWSLKPTGFDLIVVEYVVIPLLLFSEDYLVGTMQSFLLSQSVVLWIAYQPVRLSNVTDPGLHRKLWSGLEIVRKQEMLLSLSGLPGSSIGCLK